MTVVTYTPGIELEARVVDEDDGPRLTWIGYETRSSDPRSPVPTISAEALENLRTAGERNGPIDATQIDQLGLDLNVSDDVAFAWMKVCLDSEGNVTAIRAREVSSLVAARVFEQASTGWKFRPFVANGTAIPVCSLVEMVYPPQMVPKEPTVPMPSFAGGDEQLLIPDSQLKRQRIRGTTDVPPEDSTRGLIEKSHARHVAGGFRLCLDEHGKVASVKPVQSTGIPAYDQELIKSINQWVYSPYLDGGKPVAVCTAAAFEYSR
jgi:hypothetical protein